MVLRPLVLQATPGIHRTDREGMMGRDKEEAWMIVGMFLCLVVQVALTARMIVDLYR